MIRIADEMIASSLIENRNNSKWLCQMQQVAISFAFQMSFTIDINNINNQLNLFNKRTIASADFSNTLSIAHIHYAVDWMTNKVSEQ